jgi:heme O synthase-like polyprenyltransferase
MLTGRDLLKSSYLVAKQVHPVVPRYFWFLIALAVVALMLCLTAMQSWWYASLITVLIALFLGITRAIVQKANKTQI